MAASEHVEDQIVLHGTDSERGEREPREGLTAVLVARGGRTGASGVRGWCRGGRGGVGEASRSSSRSGSPEAPGPGCGGVEDGGVTGATGGDRTVLGVDGDEDAPVVFASGA